MRESGPSTPGRRVGGRSKMASASLRRGDDNSLILKDEMAGARLMKKEEDEGRKKRD